MGSYAGLGVRDNDDAQEKIGQNGVGFECNALATRRRETLTHALISKVELTNEHANILIDLNKQVPHS